MLDLVRSDSVRELIDLCAKSSPDRKFLISAETGLAITFSELQHHCQSIENYLDRNDISKGDTVAFMMDNGCWTANLMLGIIYAGRVVLPLNVVSGPDQLEYVINHSDLKVIFCSNFYKAKFASVFQNLNSAIKIIECNENNGPFGLDSDTPQLSNNTNKINKDSTALLIYTSGTTGKPKGVLLSHRNILTGGVNTMLAHQLTADDRCLCILPLYHINAEMVSIMSPLVSGGSVVISNRLSISQFWDWLFNHDCTWFSAVPTIFAYLIERHKSGSQSILNHLRSETRLRFARSASAALSPATHEAFESLFNLPIIETMGISECSGQILSNPINRTKCKVGSTGKAFGNEVRIVDANKNTIESNQQGEIAVKGENVMQGYYKNPTETAKVLDQYGWFYTGDLGYMDDDGFVNVTGRLKELIIRGGENIAPREIDDVLYRHPQILEAAAFGVPDEIYGQEVMAAVSLMPDAECDEASLLGHCNNLLGEVKCPKQIHILDQLPKGPSGKIQRLKLPGLVSLTQA